MEKRTFTVEEANALLPFFTKEVIQLQELKQQFDSTYTNLLQLKQLSVYKDKQLEYDPFFKMECSIDFLQLQLQLHIDHISTTGALLKDIEVGLVDFPAVLNEQSILLCWKLGEPSIAYYHHEHDGYSERKPLP